MKTKTLIISFLVVSLLGAFTLKANAQKTDTAPGVILFNCFDYSKDPKDTTLIADETTLTYTKTGAKIISFSESAFKAISLKWGDEFKSITIRYKTDRHGKYKEYSMYMSTELANNIKQWAKKNL
jgi:hypothetical protein